MLVINIRKTIIFIFIIVFNLNANEDKKSSKLSLAIKNKFNNLRNFKVPNSNINNNFNDEIKKFNNIKSNITKKNTKKQKSLNS